MKSLPRNLVVFASLVFPFALLLALAGAPALADDEDDLWAPTPPRLSYIDGQISFLREGAEDWVRPRPNLPLAEGDVLYTGPRANLEIQFDDRSFVRADENSQLALVRREADYIQFRVTSGLVSFDLRDMKPGDTLEVSTPSAVFLIERAGYYRVEVNARTHFITRRGGTAAMTTADGRSLSIYPSEDIVVTAGNPVQVATYAAPAPDRWDRWNDERSDRIGDSLSARYLPRGVYGAEDLDYYGSWRVVPEYGSIWIPRGVARDWSPYSTGSWIWDPYYEWTWIDDAPWGWAPFHYGRWVYVDGFWAWAPGPVVRRPFYAPALVAFMISDQDVSMRLSLGLPGLWWVSLGWGEPVHPWWGPPKYRGHPHWFGWGGPRPPFGPHDFHYRNTDHPRAVLTVPPGKFGREPFHAKAEPRFDRDHFKPVLGDLPIKPSRPNLVGGAPKGAQPPREVVNRPVVSTRLPREKALPWQAEAPRASPPALPEPRLVKPPPRRDDPTPPPPRPQFGPPLGQQAGPERTPPPLPPRLGEIKMPAPAPAPAPTPAPAKPRAPEAGRKPAPEVKPGVPPTRPEAPPRAEAPRPQAPPRAEVQDERKTLPGLPANKVFMQGQDRGSRPQGGPGNRQ